MWNALFIRQVLDADIPTPGLAGRSIDSLNAQELEYLFHSSNALRRNWTAPVPLIKRQIRIGAISETRVVVLHLLNWGVHRYVVSLAISSEGQRRFLLRCWVISTGSAVCVAQKQFPRVSGMAVNKSANGPELVAVVTPQ